MTQREPIVGTPIMTKDGRLLCYSCFNGDDTAELEYWMPDDLINYPCTCEKCRMVLIHEPQDDEP